MGISDSALVTGRLGFVRALYIVTHTKSFLLHIAAVYSSRYISDRFLPDKAIDLVDEAASALRLAQESKPDALETLDREIVMLEIERESLRNEDDVFSVERRQEVEAQLKWKREEAAKLTEAWHAGE